MDNNGDAIDNKIREYEGRIDKLKAIRSWMAEDPGLKPELTLILASPQSNGRIASVRSGPNPLDDPNFMKIKTYLKSRDPEDWVRAREIEEATGVAKGNIYFVLDKQFKDYFERHQPSPKKKFWRLKKENR